MMKEMTAYACGDDRTLPYLYLQCCSAQQQLNGESFRGLSHQAEDLWSGLPLSSSNH
jgi:hypothetical protein